MSEIAEASAKESKLEVLKETARAECPAGITMVTTPAYDVTGARGVWGQVVGLDKGPGAVSASIEGSLDGGETWGILASVDHAGCMVYVPDPPPTVRGRVCSGLRQANIFLLWPKY